MPVEFTPVRPKIQFTPVRQQAAPTQAPAEPQWRRNPQDQADIRARLDAEMAAVRAEKPPLWMRVAGSDPVMGLTEGTRDMFLNLQRVIGKGVATVGNEAVLQWKGLTGQPLVEEQLVTKPILNEAGEQIGTTTNKEMVDTWRWYEQGQPFVRVPWADPEVKNPVKRFVGGMAESLLTPEGVGTAFLPAKGTARPAIGPTPIPTVGPRITDEAAQEAMKRFLADKAPTITLKPFVDDVGSRAIYAPRPMAIDGADAVARVASASFGVPMIQAIPGQVEAAADPNLPPEERQLAGLQAALSAILGPALSANALTSRRAPASGLRSGDIPDWREPAPQLTYRAPRAFLPEESLTTLDQRFLQEQAAREAVPSFEGRTGARSRIEAERQQAIAQEAEIARQKALRDADFRRMEVEQEAEVARLREMELADQRAKEAAKARQLDVAVGRRQGFGEELPAGERLTAAIKERQIMGPSLDELRARLGDTPKDHVVASATRAFDRALQKATEDADLQRAQALRQAIAEAKKLFDEYPAPPLELVDPRKSVNAPPGLTTLDTRFQAQEPTFDFMAPLESQKPAHKTLYRLGEGEGYPPEGRAPGMRIKAAMERGKQAGSVINPMDDLQKRADDLIDSLQKHGNVGALAGEAFRQTADIRPMGMQTRRALQLNREAGALANPLPELYRMAKPLAKGAARIARAPVDAYSHQLVDRLRGRGGPVTEAATSRLREIASQAHGIYGKLAVQAFDQAKAAASKVLGGNTWLRGLGEQPTPNTRVSNWFAAMERSPNTQVPLAARRTLRLIQDANLLAGRVRREASPGFQESGLPQRVFTPKGIDILMNDVETRTEWAKGNAVLNQKDVQASLNAVSELARLYAEPERNMAAIERIAQDYARNYPRTVTHVKRGAQWVEMVQTDPAKYLEAIQRETADIVAFRREFPRDNPAILQQFIEGVSKDLSDAGNAGDLVKLHDAIRVLQGEDLDMIQGIPSVLREATAGPITALKSANLSASALANAAEMIRGGPAIFIGDAYAARSLGKIVSNPAFARELEAFGATDKLLRNWSINPRKPWETGWRYVSNTISTATGTQLLNELQEKVAAGAAKLFVDDLLADRLSSNLKKRFRTTARMMDFTEAEVNAMLRKDRRLLDQFVRKAAPWMTSGSALKAELSRAGNNAWFNGLFPYHRYSMMVTNRLRANAALWYDDLVALRQNGFKDRTLWSHFWRTSTMMGRQLMGLQLQGLMVSALVIGATGGLYGLSQFASEAENHPVATLVDAFRMAVGAPLQLLHRVSTKGVSGERVLDELQGMSATLGNFKELYDLSFGTGRYEDLSLGEKLGAFIQSRAPITKSFKLGAALTGLSIDDPELDAAVKGYWRWRQIKGMEAGKGAGREDTGPLRVAMRRVVTAMEDGRDWVKELEKVEAMGATPTERTELLTKGAGYLSRRVLLEDQHGKPLTPEQMVDLQSYIGPKALERLKGRDAMLRELSSTLLTRDKQGERPKASEVKPPEGKAATFQEASSARTARVMGKFSKETQETLRRNELTTIDYKLETRRGRPLEKGEEATYVEDRFVENFERMMANFEGRHGGKTKAQQRKIIERYLESSRERARSGIR